MSAELQTRKPTGKPPWPILLLAGAEKSGKSWACAVASGSPLITRTLWIGIGEDDPDEYGAIPGADFEIVVHDGSYRGILGAITAANAATNADGSTLFVLDSASRLWNLLVDDVQAIADSRAKTKAAKYNKPIGDDDAQVTMDLWNTAKQRWAHIMDALREHNGPVLITARLEQVTVVVGGQPTTDKTWKVQAEKSLPFDVGGVVEMPEPEKAYVRGVRSTRLKATERVEWPAFTVHDLWVKLGLADEADRGERTHQGLTVREDDPYNSPVTGERPVEGLDAGLAGVAVATELDQLTTIWNQHAPRLDVAGKARLQQACVDRKAEIIAATESTAPPADEPPSDPAQTDSQKAVEEYEAARTPASRGQLSSLAMTFTKVGLTASVGDRPKVMAICSAIAQRPIKTRNELTSPECLDVEKALNETLSKPDPEGEFAALLDMCLGISQELAA